MRLNQLLNDHGEIFKLDIFSLVITRQFSIPERYFKIAHLLPKINNSLLRVAYFMLKKNFATRNLLPSITFFLVKIFEFV